MASGADAISIPSGDLPDSPLDAVSRVQFLNNGTGLMPGAGDLLVASWDSSVRLYQVETKRLVTTISFDAPILDSCSLNPVTGTEVSAAPADACYRFVAGGLQKEVYLCDFNRPDAKRILGSHDEAVRRIAVLPEAKRTLSFADAVFTGGWDKQVKVWDERTRQQTGTVRGIRGKVFAMAVAAAQSTLIIGDSDRILYIYDVRNLDAPQEVRENVTKYQLRDIAVSPDNAVFTAATVEGRVAWEYLNTQHGPKSDASGTPVKKKNYTFKCHRDREDGGGELIHKVNALAFVPQSGSFATGGSDGNVSLWDGYQKKRLWRLPESLDMGVSSLAFSGGEEPFLAIGMAKEDQPGGGVTIRKLKSTDIMKQK